MSDARTFVASDGASIAYRDEGLGSRGEGPPLLLLHGLNAHGGFFAPQVEALGDRFRIIRPDFRGHGATPPTQAPDIARLGADVAELMGHLGLSGVIGVGWSLGATVLWEMMAGPVASAFAGLVVIDMSPRVLAAPDWTLGLIDPAMREPPPHETALERGRRIAEMIIGLETEGRAALIDRWGPELAVADPASVMALGASLYAQDCRAVLPSIRVPTLVAHGGASRFYPTETAHFIARSVQRGRVETFARSGHAPHLEEPDRFNTLFSAFAASA